MRIVSAIVVICAFTAAAEECKQDAHPHHRTQGTPAPLQPVKLRPPHKAWNLSIPSHQTCLFLRPSAVVVSACDSNAAPSVETISLQSAFIVRKTFNITTDATVYITVFCESVFKPLTGVIATPVQYPPDDCSTSAQDSADDCSTAMQDSGDDCSTSVQDSADDSCE